MNIKLRNATEADLDQILAIVNHNILHTTSNYNYEIQTLAVQSKWFQDKQSLNLPLIVADLDGIAIGYGTYGMFREKIGYQYTVEHSVYVDKKYVGKGIGGLLLAELIVLAKAQGLQVIMGDIDAENKGSITFH